MKKSKISEKFRTLNFKPVFFYFFFPILKQVFWAVLHGILGDFRPMQDPQFFDQKLVRLNQKSCSGQEKWAAEGRRAETM